MNIITENNTVRIELGSDGDKCRQFKWVNQNKVTYFLNPDLMERTGGVVNFNVGRYLEQYHPTELPKYQEHCERFEQHFNQIDRSLMN